MAEESITCPLCGMTSHNPNDVKNGYCGNCHAFTAEPGWFYLSFVDPDRPEGDQFVGGCYLQVSEEHRVPDEISALLHPRRRRELDASELAMARALAESHRLGVNPGGEVQIV